jgi:molybdopterin/thiamine biosynthesis adenylyltransferase
LTASEPSFPLHTSILVVGVGGLGCPAALAISASGVSRLGLMDPDVVEISNLHRQILYDESDLGQPKTATAERIIKRLHPRVEVETIPEAFPNTGWETLLERYDLVIDGLDRLEKKFLLNDACVKGNIPFVHAGVVRFGGQVMGVRPGRTACLRCLLPVVPPPGSLLTCQEAGILGPVPQWAGYWQAREAALLLSGDTEPLLWSLDALNRDIRSMKPTRNLDCPSCGRPSGN